MGLGSHTAQPAGQSYILSLQNSLKATPVLSDLGIMQRAPGTASQLGSVTVFCTDNERGISSSLGWVRKELLLVPHPRQQRHCHPN